MVFVTWPWLGCVDFDMGYDSAEYKAQNYMYVCLVSMITEVVLMHSDLWNGLGSLFGCEFLGMISTYISITKKYMQKDRGAPDSNR